MGMSKMSEGEQGQQDSWIVIDAGAAPAAESADPASGSPASEQTEVNPELDLCFMCDCTGSMGSYILAAQRNIQQIAQRIMTEHKADVRFALIRYRDHPPQDKTYITQVSPFTSDITAMKQAVDTMKAAGGGDGPEAVTAALHDALHLPWRPNAAKVAVLIADAPPHGLEPSGDGFPNGDPEGRDPLDIARQMAASGIVCYSVGVEPVLGSYAFARDFMCSLAEITGGQAIALGSASMLADVIINGSAEEISMIRLEKQVQSELVRVQAAAESASEKIDDEEVARRACMSLQSQGVSSMQMQTDGGMSNMNAAIWHDCKTLAGAKAALSAKGLRSQPAPPPAMMMPMMMPPLEAPAGGFDSMMMPPLEALAGDFDSYRYEAPTRGVSMAAPPASTFASEASAFPAPDFSMPPMGLAPMGMAACAMPPMQPQQQQQVASMNVLSRELVSEGQVSRMLQRQKMQNKPLGSS